MFWLSGSAFMGWALGANDASHVFGTAVATRAIRFSTAAFVFCVFVMLGATLQGGEGMHTLSRLSAQTPQTAFIVVISAAVTVTLMTVLKLPVSTSQAVVGCIIGLGLAAGGGDMNLGGLKKVVLCWVGTPVGAMVMSAALYRALGPVYNRVSGNIFVADTLIKAGLLISGAYGSYALGANNVANVTGVFFGIIPGLTQFWAVFLGGAFICVGVVTYSRRVMETVGSNLVPLEPFTALICVLAEAVTVHFYAMVGVPVSTSQAIVGAVLGIGLIKGVRSVNNKVLGGILLGWLFTPLVGGAIAYVIGSLFA